MTIGPDFDAILAAAQTGAEWAVAVLYRDINPRLLRYVRAKAPEVAEDLVAEVWLAAARQLPAFEGDERALWRWLFTLARRQVIGHWRKSGRRRTDAVPAAAFADHASGDDPAALAGERLATADAINRLTDHLSEEQAEVVLLRVLAGLDVDEVAALMGKRPGTIRVLQHRALKKLATVFAAEAVTL